MTKLNKTLKDIKKLTGSKRERAEALASKLIFQHQELERLQESIKEHGWVEVYQNGPNQSGLKKSTEGEVYNNLIKNFNATIKQVNDMLENVADEVDEIEAKYFK